MLRCTCKKKKKWISLQSSVLTVVLWFPAVLFPVKHLRFPPCTPFILPFKRRYPSKQKHETYLGQKVGEGNIDVGGIQGRGLDEHKSVLLCESLGLFGVNGTQVSQIRLVTDHHDNDVGVSVLADLGQPSRD